MEEVSEARNKGWAFIREVLEYLAKELHNILRGRVSPNRTRMGLDLLVEER
jgi:hypothetical protein